MSNTVHTLANRFPELPQKPPTYTLYYSQPELARVEPHNVIWTKKEERLNARDDQQAKELMAEFLSHGTLELKVSTHARVATRLVGNHPYRIVLDYFPDKRLGLTGT